MQIALGMLTLLAAGCAAQSPAKQALTTPDNGTIRAIEAIQPQWFYVPDDLYSNVHNDGDVFLDPGRISWSYRSPGDYNQDGLTNLYDVTALGRQFRRQSTDPGWSGSAAEVADGDGNGEVNQADLTVIGHFYGWQVAGYDIFRAVSRYDFPEGMGPDDIIAPTWSAEMVDAVGNPILERLRFEVSIPFPDAPGLENIWVRPRLSIEGAGAITSIPSLSFPDGWFERGNTRPEFNHDPLFGDPLYFVAKDTATTLPIYGYDVENDPLAIVIVQEPSQGVFTSLSGMEAVYQPNAGFTGTDDFSFCVSDGLDTSDTYHAYLYVE